MRDSDRLASVNAQLRSEVTAVFKRLAVNESVEFRADLLDSLALAIADEASAIRPVKRVTGRNVEWRTEKARRAMEQDRRTKEGVQKFLAEMVERSIDHGATIGGKEMFRVYTLWCEGAKVRPMGKIRFNTMLKSSGFVSLRTRTNHDVWADVRFKRRT